MTPRPASVTAAGVLLLIVGGKLLLLAVACVVGAPFLLAAGRGGAIFGLLIVLVGTTAVGVPFTVGGLRGLRGQLTEPATTGRALLLAGIIGLVVGGTIGLACFAPANGFGGQTFVSFLTTGGGPLFALYVAWVVDTAALLAAGVLLRRPVRTHPPRRTEVPE